MPTSKTQRLSETLHWQHYRRHLSVFTPISAQPEKFTVHSPNCATPMQLKCSYIKQTLIFSHLAKIIQENILSLQPPSPQEIHLYASQTTTVPCYGIVLNSTQLRLILRFVPTKAIIPWRAWKTRVLLNPSRNYWEKDRRDPPDSWKDTPAY